MGGGIGTNSVYTNSSTTSNSSNNLNQSQSTTTSNGPVVSPKTNKPFDVNYEEAKLMMMKKRSPNKN